MKKIMAGLISLMLIAAAGFSMAQDAASSADISAVSPKGKVEIRERLRNQVKRIAQGQRSGALSKDQVEALQQKLKSIGDKTKSFFLANGKKPLTDKQKNQINQLLDENSKAICQAKHPGKITAGDSRKAVPDDNNETN